MELTRTRSMFISIEGLKKLLLLYYLVLRYKITQLLKLQTILKRQCKMSYTLFTKCKTEFIIYIAAKFDYSKIHHTSINRK